MEIMEVWMSLDIILIGAVFLLLAFIGCFVRKGQSIAYQMLILLLAVGGFLIMVCGVTD